jgi:uncharacterized protein (DUF58 family)
MFSGFLNRLLGVPAPAEKQTPEVPATERHAKLRRVEIVASQLVQEVFGGQYESLFKGQGIEFSEIREYFPGDDVRNIDWNVTARLGRPFIKRNDEERELAMVLLLDGSSSMDFGSGKRSKRDLAGEIAAILAFSALQNGDKVGLIRFTTHVDHVLPPRKGRKHVMRMLGEMMADHTDQPTQSRLDVALDAVCRIYKRKSLVFVLSDFLCDNYESALKRAGRRHDLSCMRFYDRREEEMPAIGKLRLRDLESGQSVMVDTSASGFCAEYQQKAQERRKEWKKTCDAAQVAYADFGCHEDAVPLLTRFFANKIKRKGRKRKVAS